MLPLRPFQSTLSVRRATGTRRHPSHERVISIHALRKESDLAATVPRGCFSFQSTLSVRRATRISVFRFHAIRISIHALRKESDWMSRKIGSVCAKFQSTLSVRRATHLPRLSLSITLFQSTLSVRRATSHRTEPQRPNLRISIHALRKESDGSSSTTCEDIFAFQSTLSVRRATREHG